MITLENPTDLPSIMQSSSNLTCNPICKRSCEGTPICQHLCMSVIVLWHACASEAGGGAKSNRGSTLTPILLVRRGLRQMRQWMRLLNGLPSAAVITNSSLKVSVSEMKYINRVHLRPQPANTMSARYMKPSSVPFFSLIVCS